MLRHYDVMILLKQITETKKMNSLIEELRYLRNYYEQCAFEAESVTVSDAYIAKAESVLKEIFAICR